MFWSSSLADTFTYLHFRLGRSGRHLAPGLVVARLQLLLHVVQLLAGREGEDALQLAVHQVVLIRLFPLEIQTSEHEHHTDSDVAIGHSPKCPG